MLVILEGQPSWYKGKTSTRVLTLLPVCMNKSKDKALRSSVNITNFAPFFLLQIFFILFSSKQNFFYTIFFK